MKRQLFINTALAAVLGFLPLTSFAQDAEILPVPAQNQDRCIAQMAEFPTDDALVRYQFFKLVQDASYGATAESSALFDHYGQPTIELDTPVLATIEDIVNPVLRQAAPEYIVASMDYMIDFAVTCDVYITGQMESLLAFDATLSHPDFNAAIAEDALFLRQILNDSLYALGVDADPQWSRAAQNYAGSLVAQRNAVEYTAFESEVADLEMLFMDDLDGRLKRSNDTINAEIDRETLRDSVALNNDIVEAAEEKARRERRERFRRLFGGRSR